MIFATALLVLSQAVEPHHVLIAGGGTSRRDASRAQDQWVRDRKAIDELIDGTAATIVESATVPGLKPGFFVVVVGVCDAKEAREVLPLFKLASAGVYERAIAPVALPLACPHRVGKIDREDRVSVGTVSLGVSRIKVGADKYRIIAVLRDHDGRVLDVADLTQPQQGPPGTVWAPFDECDRDFHRAGNGWRVSGCAILDADGCNGTMRTIVVSIDGTKMRRERSETPYGIPCD